MGAGGVEWPFVLEVFDEDEDSADTEVDHGLVAGQLKKYNGIVLLLPSSLGAQSINVACQAGECRVLEDLDSMDFE